MQQLLPIEDRVSTLKEATKAILLAKMATLREQAAPGGEQSKRDSAVKAGVPEGGATEGGQSKRASAIKTGVTEGDATEGGATEELTMLSAVLNYTQVPNPKEFANLLESQHPEARRVMLQGAMGPDVPSGEAARVLDVIARLPSVTDIQAAAVTREVIDMVAAQRAAETAQVARELEHKQATAQLELEQQQLEYKLAAAQLELKERHGSAQASLRAEDERGLDRATAWRLQRGLLLPLPKHIASDVLSTDPKVACEQFRAAEQLGGWTGRGDAGRRDDAGRLMSCILDAAYGSSGEWGGISPEEDAALQQPGLLMIDFQTVPVLIALLDTTAGQRGLAVFQARQEQAAAWLISAARRECTEGSTARAMAVAKARAEKTGVFGAKLDAVFAVIKDAVPKHSKKDGEQAALDLASKSTHWESSEKTYVENVEEALKFVTATHDLCEQVGFHLNESFPDSMQRILFDESTGHLPTKLNSWWRTNRYGKLVEEENLPTALLAFTNEVSPRRLQLTFQSASSLRPVLRRTEKDSASARQVQDLKAKIAALEGKQGQHSSQKPSQKSAASEKTTAADSAKSTRAAAAAVIETDDSVPGLDGISIRTNDSCKGCNKKGHRLEQCPTVVYTPGKEGKEIVKWMQCWNCDGFGHSKNNCPKPQKNGGASTASSKPVTGVKP